MNESADQPVQRSGPAWGLQLKIGASVYCITTVMVLVGVLFGVQYIPRRGHFNQNDRGFINSLTNWDGVWYTRIVEDGYSYDPSAQSSVAFFPLYPVVARGVSWVTCLPTDYSLLLTSHLCLIAVFVLAVAYIHQRYPGAAAEKSEWVLLAMGLWPTTFFFRIAYTESVFMLLTLLALWAMQRRWPVVPIAIIVGLTSACRATGVALLLPLTLHLWQSRSSTRNFIFSLSLLPLACWGLIAYMAYQYAEFGDAFAFVKTQQHWAVRQPQSAGEYAYSLATLEPIWAKFDPGSAVYWARGDKAPGPLFSWEFANPFYFIVTAVLVGVGARKRWLNGQEILLAVGLLAVPYLTHSYRAAMLGHARYSAAVFPVYLVMGHLLSRMPAPMSAIALAISALLLGIYSALFASWHPLF